MDHRVPCAGFLFREKPKVRRMNREALAELKPSKLEILDLKEGKDVYHEDGSVKFENKLMTLNPAASYSYAYCSDTRYKPVLKSLIEGVDMMYHEATFADDMKERAGATYHTTAAQAAQFAKDAKVGKLLLGHFSARYRELDPILEEARMVFEHAELAIEGTVFTPNEK